MIYFFAPSYDACSRRTVREGEAAQFEPIVAGTLAQSYLTCPTEHPRRLAIARCKVRRAAEHGEVDAAARRAGAQVVHHPFTSRSFIHPFESVRARPPGVVSPSGMPVRGSSALDDVRARRALLRREASASPHAPA